MSPLRRTQPTNAPPRVRRPGSRGWPGRGRGSSPHLQAPGEWRATTVQACGLWPFSAGTGTPMSGVPLGPNLVSGATLCCDPISWFQQAKLIANPSMFVLGKPGLGKSTLVRRMVLGLAGYGVIPAVFGDTKPDYVDPIRAIDGQAITIGPGLGSLNILDPGEVTAAAKRLVGTARTELLADAHSRRTTMVSALLNISRGAPPSDRESSIIDRALHVLDDRSTTVPILPDLLRVIREAPETVRHAAIDRGSFDRYQEITEDLEASLVALTGTGPLGDVFAGHTTVAMRRDRPVVYDLHSIGDGQDKLQAAALLACWSVGFGTINVAHALADAGLEPRRHYFVVMDELWKALRAGRGIVDHVDALTRLNRTRGVGMAMVSHTLADLEALPFIEDRAKAKGFVERAGMVMLGGLPAREMAELDTIVNLSRAEQRLLVDWTMPPPYDPRTGAPADPPGMGNFLVKVGGRAGIPFHLRETLVEKQMKLNDTNKVWKTASRIGTVADLTPVDDLLDAAAAEGLAA